jgi:hypothetical protein
MVEVMISGPTPSPYATVMGTALEDRKRRPATAMGVGKKVEEDAASREVRHQRSAQNYDAA